jgi:hypothetical protein
MFQRIGDDLKFLSKCNYQLVAKKERTVVKSASVKASSSLKDGHSLDIIHLLAAGPKSLTDIAKILQAEEADIKAEANKVFLVNLILF